MRTIREALSQYITVRRALGATFQEPALTLGHFVTFLEEKGVAWITTDLALRWACQSAHVQRATWVRRLGMVRGFASWLSAFDPHTEVPPKRILSARHRRQKPYIFTDREIEHLMAEASRLPSANGLRAWTHVTLIGMLVTTGLRPGEALSLDESDVDLENGILAIRDTKFGKSRFVPITDSTCTALARYAKKRLEICKHLQTNGFLIGERGNRLSPYAARRTFAKISTTLGLRKAVPGKRIGRGPRLQDMRHTFATRKIIEWYRSGLDVERELPKLTKYLGHNNIGHTYWYIEAIPELLQLATEYMSYKEVDHD